VPLAADALPRIEARLERLLRAHDHRSVLGLTRRLLEVEAGQDLPRTAGLRVMQARLTSLRHLGCSTEALDLAARLRATTVELGPALSHDDRALADLECAASLFDPGRFPELLELLEPWRERCGADPLLLPASTRIRIWNTIARARIASGAAGWEVLLDASVDLQRQTDPAGCVRTANYRIEGLLRAGRLDEAAAAIARNLAEVGAEDRYSQRMIASYRAQHARRAGARWQAEDADRALAGPIADELGPWHPLGLYELAVARQAGRGADEVERRLERAARAFAADQPEGGEPGPLRLLELVARLGAAEASAVPARVAAARAALGGLGLPGPVGAEVDRIVADAEGPAFGILCDALPWC
jgi:hypothetical protein